MKVKLHIHATACLRMELDERIVNDRTALFLNRSRELDFQVEVPASVVSFSERLRTEYLRSKVREHYLEKLIEYCRDDAELFVIITRSPASIWIEQLVYKVVGRQWMSDGPVIDVPVNHYVPPIQTPSLFC